MKCLKKVVGVGLLAVSISANAGFYGNTAHSRGNCAGFNESITWNWSEYHWWKVDSMHWHQKGHGQGDHKVTAFMAYTWRSAAFDFMKDPSDQYPDQYRVEGYHFYMDYNGKVIYDVHTQSTDCGGYDGWWDKIKAKGE
jgi:hypothetical protein